MKRVVSVVIFIAIVVSAVVIFKTTGMDERIGGQRDLHGCLGPAGYTWNEEIGVCSREWEIEGDEIRAAKITTEYLDSTGRNSFGLTLVNVTYFHCPGCYTVEYTTQDYEPITVTIEDWRIFE